MQATLLLSGLSFSYRLDKAEEREREQLLKYSNETCRQIYL